MKPEQIKKQIADMQAAYDAGTQDEKDMLEPIIESAKAKLKEIEGKPAPAKVEKPKAVKKTAAPKPKAVKKAPVKRRAKTVAKKSPVKKYDWGEKVAVKGLPQVQYKDGFRLIVLDDDAELTIADVTHSLKKGDAIAINSKGFPVTFFTPQSQKTNLVPLADAVPETAKPKPAPAPKKPEAQPAESAATPAKKKGSCELGKGQSAKAQKGGIPAPALQWLIGMVEAWKVKEYHGKIARMYFDKTNSKVYVRIEWYDPIWRKSILKKNILASRGLYSVCMRSGKITKSDLTRRMQVLAGKEDLDKLYSTRDNYSQCRKLIKRAYEACRDGECTKEDKALYSQFYHECGDDVQKEKNIDYIRYTHRETRKTWKKGKEPYLDAYKRTMKIIRAKAAKA